MPDNASGPFGGIPGLRAALPYVAIQEIRNPSTEEIANQQQSTAGAVRPLRQGQLVVEVAERRSRGEAAAEFLIALGCGRLRLHREHNEDVPRSPAEPPPFVDALGSRYARGCDRAGPRAQPVVPGWA